jgi:alanyl-tRNA synthetase
VIFKLYDTFGFPMDLTGDIARERGLTLDEAGFESAMQAQRERARSASQFGLDYNNFAKIDLETEFQGYEDAVGSGQVVALFREGQEVDWLKDGESGVVILDKTPFYAESGGQVGDTGYLEKGDMRFDVRDTTKSGLAHLHRGVIALGELRKGDIVHAVVDDHIRQATKLNHSATHLLHAALRKVLGEHVQQKGSLVDSQRLRFDFSHFEAISAQQLREIEDMVNEQLRLNTLVAIEVTDIETAKSRGAMALFGEKYGDQVRVLTMGDGFSVELCGGTHVSRTGDIGLLRMTNESGIAAGVRRIEAVTGSAALGLIHEGDDQLRQIGQIVKGTRETVLEKVSMLVERTRQMEKDIEQLQAKLASAAGSDMAAEVQLLGGMQVLVKRVDKHDGKALLALVDQLKNKLGSAVVLLAGEQDGKVVLVAGVTKDLTAQVKAGDLIRNAAAVVAGKGGGRPDMAQGGGTDVDAIDRALSEAVTWLAQQSNAQ